MLDRLQRNHRHAKQPIRIGGAIIHYPPVVSARAGRCKIAIAYAADQEPYRGIKKPRIDTVDLQVFYAGMGIESSLFAVGIFLRCRQSFPDTDTAQASNPHLSAKYFTFDPNPFLAVSINND